MQIAISTNSRYIQIWRVAIFLPIGSCSETFWKEIRVLASLLLVYFIRFCVMIKSQALEFALAVRHDVW
jgi:hypothetical protein